MSSATEGFLDKLDFPLYIVTAAAGGELSGCIVGFVTQCSMDPVRLLVCISDKNHTHEVALRSSTVAVHLVPAERSDLVDLFGSHSGYEIDKFSRCRWTEGPEGVPLLEDCPSRLVGSVLSRTPVGDHTALLVEVTGAEEGSEQRLYTFSMAKIQNVDPGRDP